MIIKSSLSFNRAFVLGPYLVVIKVTSINGDVDLSSYRPSLGQTLCDLKSLYLNKLLPEVLTGVFTMIA